MATTVEVSAVARLARAGRICDVAVRRLRADCLRPGDSRWHSVRRFPRKTDPPKLLDRVRAAVRTRHYSRRTEEAYAAWIRRYIVFQLTGTMRLMVMLLYGAGLRLEECLELRVKDLDFDRHQISVRQEGPEGSGDDAALGGEGGVDDAPGGRAADA